ncbi:hypothetical protein GCM10007425_08170 [Lysinibacillus alkalisoli]|uniref:HTH marR-type domain-containing protein n=1 Tax=Lysinibacillus alkalisoli TaxID=1911548 RepID=A0A917LE60_9BACI|nr:MarR family transcriptional regulator [Lysinibacillus alkalisoli]GGG16185.1 hypothetical protein GCM10007425_08170 [Lysinibacillus alkalisoli]
MEVNLEKIDLIDVLSERHGLLRRVTMRYWDAENNMPVSNREWYILSRIYNQQATIAMISKNVDISRQATHKCIKQLEAKGLVNIKNVPENKKEKAVELTVLGTTCYQQHEAIKARIIDELRANIGEEQVMLLQQILLQDWKLT